MTGAGIFIAGFITGILFTCACAVIAYRALVRGIERVENIPDDYSDGDTRPASLLNSTVHAQKDKL